MELSIIIPALNEEYYIGTLLTCLTNQTYKNFEVIVVDGNSVDATRDKVLEFAGLLNIRCINAKRKGISFQRNLGVKFAKGENLIFLDADGYIGNEFLEQVMTYAKAHPDIDVMTAWIEPISTKKIDKLLFFTYNQFYLDLIKNIKPQGGGAFVFVRKVGFEKINGFDEKSYVAEDHDFFARAHKAGLKYHLLKNPPIKTSVRRLEKQGRLRYIWAMGKGAVYMHFIGPIESSKIIDYMMDEGGAFYKTSSTNFHDTFKFFKRKKSQDPDTH